MRVATTAVVALALLLGSTTVVPQAPPVDGKQYPIAVFKLDAPRQSYEKVCQFFYWSKILGEGKENELVGFNFVRGDQTEKLVTHIKALSVMINESTPSPTAQVVSTQDGGHYVLWMNSHDHNAESGCIADIAPMKK